MLLSKNDFLLDIALFRFYLEDYWLFRAVDRVSQLLPNANWIGIFDYFSTWEEAEFSTEPDVPFPFYKRPGEHLKVIDEVRSYSEADHLLKSIRQEYQPSKVIISPTHLVSRLSYEYYVKKYSNLKILTLDAHDDRGSGNFPDNLWISDDIAARTILIGGLKELDLKNRKSAPYMGFFKSVKTAIDSYQFEDALRKQNLLLTIDLDFFQESKWGLPTYLLRELFIGHSMNIVQIIMRYLARNPTAEHERVTIGDILGLFSSQRELEAFKLERLESINREGQRAKDEISLLLDSLEDMNVNLISVDLCELCAPLDYENAGKAILIDLCNNLLSRY